MLFLPNRPGNHPEHLAAVQAEVTVKNGDEFEVAEKQVRNPLHEGNIQIIWKVVKDFTLSFYHTKVIYVKQAGMTRERVKGYGLSYKRKGRRRVSFGRLR